MLAWLSSKWTPLTITEPNPVIGPLAEAAAAPVPPLSTPLPQPVSSRSGINIVDNPSRECFRYKCKGDMSCTFSRSGFLRLRMSLYIGIHSRWSSHGFGEHVNANAHSLVLGAFCSAIGGD